jgi:hypothetical protein
MKNYLLISIITLFTWLDNPDVFSQSPVNRGYIGYSVGPSFHVGKLDYISSDNEREKFAKTGYFINYANFAYFRKGPRNPGLAASVFYGETFVENSQEMDWWIVMGFSVGPVFTFRIIEKLNLDLKLEVGRARTITPIKQIAIRDDFGGGFSMDFCNTYRYNVYRRWSLLLEAGYFTTKQKYPDNRAVRIQKIYTGIGVVYSLR